MTGLASAAGSAIASGVASNAGGGGGGDPWSPNSLINKSAQESQQGAQSASAVPYMQQNNQAHAAMQNMMKTWQNGGSFTDGLHAFVGGFNG